LGHELGVLLLSAALALGATATTTGTPWFVFISFWFFGMVFGWVLASGAFVPVWQAIQAFFQAFHEEHFANTKTATPPRDVEIND
jgi:hypothetical protein